MCIYVFSLWQAQQIYRAPHPQYPGCIQMPATFSNCFFIDKRRSVVRSLPVSVASRGARLCLCALCVCGFFSSASVSMCVCVSQRNLLRGKLVNTFQIKKKVSKTIILRGWWISLAWSTAAVINRHFWLISKWHWHFQFWFFISLHRWKLLNPCLTKPLAIS